MNKTSGVAQTELQKVAAGLQFAEGSEPMCTKKLTVAQTRVLDFIKEFIAIHKHAPTMREIGNALGIRSTNGVNDHLRVIERKGYIRRGGDGKARTLALTEKALGGALNPASAATATVLSCLLAGDFDGARKALDEAEKLAKP